LLRLQDGILDEIGQCLQALYIFIFVPWN